ncbi:MAG: S8 family peptidase [Candidatus Aureabacteria bacterium]|nr:S8 family peptidase [Candidatus Auribacterota bacterium]
MVARPLLIFPAPELASKSKLGGGPGKIHRPTHTRQGQRLSPLFAQLQQAVDNRRLEIQRTMAGIDPEQVLVIETIGSIENFANAVKKIEGLEWMGEIEAAELAPDRDFYDEKNADKTLGGRLYLVMTNQRALKEMFSLWNRYKGDSNMQFVRGLTKFRDVFLCLKNIRRWDVQDRLMETGLIEVWKEDLSHDGQRMIKFETELWFRGSSEKRTTSQQQVAQLIQNLGGNIKSQCVIEDISYHSLFAELPADKVQEIINNPSTDLVKCDNIMFLRPVGQMAIGKENIEGDLSENVSQRELTTPSGNAIVAVFDGMPMANHELLAGRLIVDDPDDWSSSYAVKNRIHGTTMCSLIAHGDLNDNQKPLSTPIYVRPIIKPPLPPFDDKPEEMPQDCLVVDLVHNAVRRLFNTKETKESFSSSVKIINLSIGDVYRQFTQVMSPLARLLDWLSEKYNILFIISAGNHTIRIPIGMTPTDFDDLSEDERQGVVLKALYENARHRKILSPAESINGLTVGALHYDSSQIGHLGDRHDLYSLSLPSPISAFGSGYRRAVKPDMLFSGGKLLFRKETETSGNLVFVPANTRLAPGSQVASPSQLAGDLKKTAFCQGTSNAAALASRSAVICYEVLDEIFNDQSINISDEFAVAPLIKAMLTHGCAWGEIYQYLDNILNASKQNNSQIKNWISQWAGYGVSDINKVLGCTEQRATMLGFGYLNDEEAHVFRLPLPPSLSSRKDRRKITITLAWLSPIASSTQKYRVASLWFEALDNKLSPQRLDGDWRSVRRGTLQHEIFEGDKAVPISDGDSLRIKVNCKKEAGKIIGAVPYGLVVSLEVAEGIEVPIYEEIKNRIVTQVKID